MLDPRTIPPCKCMSNPGVWLVSGKQLGVVEHEGGVLDGTGTGYMSGVAEGRRKQSEMQTLQPATSGTRGKESC